PESGHLRGFTTMAWHWNKPIAAKRQPLDRLQLRRAVFSAFGPGSWVPLTLVPRLVGVSRQAVHSRRQRRKLRIWSVRVADLPRPVIMVLVDDLYAWIVEREGHRPKGLGARQWRRKGQT